MIGRPLRGLGAAFQVCNLGPGLVESIEGFFGCDPDAMRFLIKRVRQSRLRSELDLDFLQIVTQQKQFVSATTPYGYETLGRSGHRQLLKPFGESEPVTLNMNGRPKRIRAFSESTEFVKQKPM